MDRTIAVVGGDMRQVCLAQLLLEDEKNVVTWALEKGGGPNAVSLNQALEAQIVILPLPVCRAGALNLPLTDIELDAERLWPRLRYDQLLLGGMTGELSARLMLDYGLTLLDYYDREEAQIANAVPTALAIGHRKRPGISKHLCRAAFACMGNSTAIFKAALHINTLAGSIWHRRYINAVKPNSRRCVWTCSPLTAPGEWRPTAGCPRTKTTS